ncbi:MAG: hypothetical protein JW973_14490 [Bacteroidales bacterium]|nr:hypothetical protein [Bacteroidales bacterium]
MKAFLCFILFLTAGILLRAQTTDDLLNLLIRNHIITLEQADSMRAEAAIADQANQSKLKSFAVNAGKKIRLGGYGHFRYQFLEEEGKTDGFDIRRIYVDLKASITPYWDFRLQTDFAGSPKIMDIYADLNINDWLNFTIGQQTIPFSLNNTTSNAKLELTDRSQAVEALSLRNGDVLGNNNGRDIGISVYGSFIALQDRKLFNYRIGVFNGSGINKADLNEAKDIVGRIILHPLQGLDLGGSFYYGWTPDSATLDNQTVPTQLGLRQRAGAEINYTWRFLNMKCEYITGTDGTIRKAGYYGQIAGYVIPDKLQIAGRYDVYDRNADENDTVTTNYTMGVNYYINRNVTLQGSYTLCHEEGIAFRNNIGSVQLQISF